MKTASMKLATLLAAALLGGCAALSSVSSEVSSFGEWPAGRSAGSYAFERLPSQQAHGAATTALESAAIPALAKAGFTPVAAGQEPDVLVQVGARTSRADFSPWDDPIWWRGGFGYGFGRYNPWMGPSWHLHMRHSPPRYEREVAVLIRDSRSGRPLYESRASNEGTHNSSAITGAMFEAALMDFPRLGVNPRRVVVQVPPAS